MYMFTDALCSWKWPLNMAIIPIQLCSVLKKNDSCAILWQQSATPSSCSHSRTKSEFFFKKKENPSKKSLFFFLTALNTHLFIFFCMSTHDTNCAVDVKHLLRPWCERQKETSVFKLRSHIEFLSEWSSFPSVTAGFRLVPSTVCANAQPNKALEMEKYIPLQKKKKNNTLLYRLYLQIEH